MDQGMSNLVAARALASALAATPPRLVVLSPGARSAPLVLAMAQAAGLTLEVALDERAAAFVALGWAKATGRAAVLVCTSGSAGGHYLPALMEAWHGRVPLVPITADRPAELQHTGAMQATDQRALFGHHVLAVRELPTPLPRGAGAAGESVTRAWRTLAAQALHLAEGGPGPVHLNAPFREPLLPSADGPSSEPAPPAEPQPPSRAPSAPAAPTEAALQRLRAWLAQAGPGVIVAGPLPSGPGQAGLPAAVRAVGRALNWPILADPISNLRVAAPGEVACLTAYDRALARGAPPDASVLVVGDVVTSKRLGAWIAARPRGSVHAVRAPGQFHDPHLLDAPSTEADLQVLCQSLVQSPLPAAPDAHRRAWQAWDKAAAPAVVAEAAPGLTPERLWPALLNGLPQGAALHVGSSTVIRDLDAWGGPMAPGLRVTASRGLNGIDGAIATLLGLTLGDPRPWVAAMGDLTFLHDLGALQLARQLNRAATLVVVQNNGGQIFARLPLAAHSSVFERFFLTPQQADLAALCAACACGHEVVYTPAALQHAVARATARPPVGPLHVIEAQVAPPPV